jgi:hypothetical protein
VAASRFLRDDLPADVRADYELLCNVCDQLTHNGSDMTAYDRLLQPAVDSIVAPFRKRVAMNRKFHSGKWNADLPPIEQLRRDRRVWQ